MAIESSARKRERERDREKERISMCEKEKLTRGCTIREQWIGYAGQRCQPSQRCARFFLTLNFDRESSRHGADKKVGRWVIDY